MSGAHSLTSPAILSLVTSTLEINTSGGSKLRVVPSDEEISMETLLGKSVVVSDNNNQVLMQYDPSNKIILNNVGTNISGLIAGTDYGAGSITGTPTFGLAVDTSGNFIETVLGTGAVTSVSGTVNRITSTGGTTPVIDISATFEGLLGKVANPLSQFASTTSAQLAGVLSDETGGAGLAVFNSNPTLAGATFTDATNIVFNTTTGTKIGTATTQKLSFYNSTPIVQPTGNVFTALVNLGLVASPSLAESDITNLVSDLALKAPLASPTFTGTVTIPTPFTLGATSVTSTGTQLNYLNAATGTTGTTSTNLVFSTSPTFITPTLGAALATSINGNIFTTGSSTYTGTAGQTYTFPATTSTLAMSSAAQTFTGTQTFGTIISNNIQTATTSTNANLMSIGQSSGQGLSAAVSTASYITGGNNIQFRVGIRGSTATVTTAGADVFALAIGDNTYIEAVSGTSALGGGLYIKTQTFTGGAGATTDFQNAYIGDAPTGAVNNWALNTGSTLIRDKLSVTTGSNKSIGVSGAMTAGTITISTTAVAAASKIFLTHASIGGTIGVPSVGTIVAGTSFVINSSSALDTSTVNWWIIN